MSSNGAPQQGQRARIIKFKLPSPKERKRKRVTVYSSESLVRSVRFLRYCVVCSASLIRAVAPWGLAVVEVATMLLLYFAAVPSALLVRRRLAEYDYGFTRSLEDVVALSLARGAAITAAYFTGAGQKHHRPYMYTAYAFAAAGVPFAVAKLLAFSYPTHSAPAILVLLTSLAFSGLNLTAAHNVVRWARHRADMGLDGFGYPWEEGEEAWVMLGRTGVLGPAASGVAAGSSAYDEWAEDVSPRALADADSQFVECGSLSVHVKEAAPPAGQGSNDTGLMLIHGYGSGTFAWRHIMGPLAETCRCRVIAFDRPAFGLTSRPRPPTRGDSPYSLRSAARLAMALSSQMGLKRVMFVGHADGALVALLATAMAAHPRTSGGHQTGWSAGPRRHSDDGFSTADSSSAAGGSSAGHSRQGSDSSAVRRLTESVLKGRPGSGTWRSLLPGALAPLAERSSSESSDVETGLLLPRPQQGQHREDAEEHQVHAAVSAPPSGMAPGASAASLKLRGAVPGGAVAHQTASPSSTLHGHTASSARSPPPTRTDSVSSVTPSSVSGGKSSGGGTAGSPLTVLAVALPARGSSDSATVSEDFADDCGLYSPMLSPRQRADGVSRESSSADDLTIELTSARGGDMFAPPPLQRAPSAQSTGLPDEWRGLLTDSGEGGGHYFDSELPPPEALGLALLHPNMAGSVGPSFTRLLARSQLGRRMLRPLLRSEVGEVSNRRAWHEPALLTAEVLEHYKRPLRARNWDAALVEVSRLPMEVSDRQLAGLCGTASRLPTAVATGAHDRVSPAARAAQLAEDLGGAPPTILPACGHLSHEEAPEALQKFLAEFVHRSLAAASGRDQLEYTGG